MMRFHLDTAGPEANPARGVWLLGGERDRPRNKKVTIKVQEREPMFSRRRKTEQSREREKGRGNKHQTERNDRKTNQNSQVLCPAIKKPISNNYKDPTLWSSAFLVIQSSLHRQYLVPRFYYSFRYDIFPMQAPWQLRGYK